MRSLVGLGLGLWLWLSGCVAEEPVEGLSEAVHACGTLPDGGGTRWCADEGWDGGYNCVDNSCHNAASLGVNDHKGILSCHGYYTGPYGHTINWDNPEAGTICLEEPQRPGEGPAERQTCNATTLRGCIAVAGCRWVGARAPYCTGTPTSPAVTGGTCCWRGGLTTAGVPNLTSAAAQNCVSLLCPPSLGAEGPAIAHPPGHVWDVSYTECATNNAGNRDACVACCENNANAVPDDWGVGFMCEREDYRSRCRASCGAGPSPSARLPCECIGNRLQCLAARCGWRLDGSGCATTPTTPGLPPAPPYIDAGSSSEAGSDAATDASSEAGSEAGTDASTDASSEAGSEAGTDASTDASSEAGAARTR